MKRGRWTWWLDGLLICLLAAAIVRPLFKAKYLDKWSSIESTFISDARFLRDHWPHPRWQPNWYLGTRFDYIYPPALRYGTAAIAKINPRVLPVKAYHIYTALLFCLGLAGVYVLARTGADSRAAGWLAAIATALVSPSFLLIGELRADEWHWTPQRLSVMVRYGEGPHMSSLAILGFALAFSWRALRKHSPGWLALAALFCALVVSHNFYGATALAILFPILAWSLWITHQDHGLWWRAILIAVVAYGFTAFWLVPTYLRVTLDNMKYVSSPGNKWSLWVALLLAILYVKATERWAKGRPERAWAAFLAGAAAFFVLNVVGNYYLKFRVIGEPLRMAPELDLALILVMVELMRRAWRARRKRLWRPVAALVLVSWLPTGLTFLSQAWTHYLADPDYTQRVEYKITSWMATNMPEARAMAVGTVRFWYNAWHDLQQLGGGSEQGLLNPVTVPAYYYLALGEDTEGSIVFMQSVGVDAIIVHDKNSQEPYKDFQHPEQFAGKLEVLHDSGQGDVIYRIPRRYPGLARVVDTAKLDALGPSAHEPGMAYLKPWAELIEKGPEAPTETQWRGPEVLDVKAPVAAGQSLMVLETYDRAWRAYANGKPVAIRRGPLNFMRLDPPPGTRELRLAFETPRENIVGWGLTLITVVCWLGLLRAAWRKREAA